MTEAEVILRLALFYIRNNLTSENVMVSIDGAHVKTKDKVHFDIFKFLQNEGLTKIDPEPNRWQGEYALNGFNSHVVISSTPGIGDVNVRLNDGRRIYAECKKSKNSKNSRVKLEYSLMREAIGQLMTGCNFVEGLIPMVAVPYTVKSKELAVRWSELIQIKNLGIKFALIRENGEVEIV